MQSCKDKVLSNQYRDFIIKNDIPPKIKKIPIEERCEEEIAYGYRCIYIEESLASPLTLSDFYYSTIPSCYELLDLNSLNDAGILAVQNYPALDLKGENVLVGIIDTGIDYQNQVFKDIDGKSRILAVWDQTIQKGKPPVGFVYGSEYRKEEIDKALQSENPYQVVPTKDENGHGTFVASIAAGSSDTEATFLGVAPESKIAVVKLKEAKQYLREFYFAKEGAPCYQENDIMFAIKYLKQLADELKLPIAISIALGTNLGSHIGSSALSESLNDYALESSMAVVTGAGNLANKRQHYVNEEATTMDVVEIQVGDNVEGFIAELWTNIPNILEVNIISPSGETVAPDRITRGEGEKYQFIFEGTIVYVDYRLLVEGTGSELVFMRFQQPTKGIWKVRVNPVDVIDERFHIWLTSQNQLTDDVFFLKPNPDTTINEPGNAWNPITVSYYNSTNNSTEINSGRGYTRTNNSKPDFAAPGVDVMGALPNRRYGSRTGSSPAIAITTGACALLLEWTVNKQKQENISTVQIKNLLIIGAKREEGTTYPCRNYGWGLLDLFNTFLKIRDF